jgi:FkbH-like protein
LTPLVAELCVRTIAASRGKSKRCLVMDLDNTLWGGVVGDDGIDGIRVGAGDPVGEAFAQIQRHAKRLKERGVVLAVSSKNDHEVALRAFRTRRGMVLTPEDIAVFQANWEDKAANVAAIAEVLDLGLQSLVFLDDNPMERARVREALPEVSVPELPADPADYPAALGMAGYFDVVSFSEEDRKRAEFYEGNARRIELKSKLGDLGDFLRSLDMEMEIRPFARDSLPRVVDLINKSNQFNLTTRRYTAPQVEAMCADAEIATYQARLADRFGDNGLITAVICRRAVDAWTIDSWIMSCRVLGREVERALLNRIVEDARAAGARHLLGVFLPSGRNDLVRDHYRNLGFGLAEARSDGATSWRLAVADCRPAVLPMRLV